MPFVSAVIPTIPGREDLLKKLLDSLPNDVEKVIVPDVGMSLAAKRNKGAALSEEYYILFIDDDNYLAPGAIEALIYNLRSDIGIIGMTACYDSARDIVADGGSKRSMLTGFMSGCRTNEYVNDCKETYFVDEVANAFLMPRHVFEKMGGFDEANFPIDLDEADMCRRVKEYGYKIAVCPSAICYHKSQTYSYIPDFRRPMNAYFMGRNRVLFQRKHLSRFSFIVYLFVFFPVFYLFYVASLLYRRKLWMIVHFTKGVYDGLRGCRINRYFR